MERKEYEKKVEKCKEFINKVSSILGSNWELVASCNADISCYLIPKGTKSELTYYGKPGNSLRFSDHWNWYSNIKKCSNEHYVQCENKNMPYPMHRDETGKATRPRFGVQVAYYDVCDGCYHHIYGDKYNRRTKTWRWASNDPYLVANMLLSNKV